MAIPASRGDSDVPTANVRKCDCRGAMSDNVRQLFDNFWCTNGDFLKSLMVEILSPSKYIISMVHTNNVQKGF